MEIAFHQIYLGWYFYIFATRFKQHPALSKERRERERERERQVEKMVKMYLCKLLFEMLQKVKSACINDRSWLASESFIRPNNEG